MWRKGGATRRGDIELGIATILLAVAILLTAIAVPALQL